MKIRNKQPEVPSIHKGLCANGKGFRKFLKIEKDSHMSLGFTFA